MTREFPDELLSAFLDNELSPAERAQVEQHLARSEGDRQLLAELKSLRGDVAALPKVPVNPEFADRVVRAAVAEAQKHNAAAAAVSLAPPAAKRSSRRWMIGAAVAGAAALAACSLLVVQPWRRSPAPNQAPQIVKAIAPAVEQAVAIKDQFVNALQAAVPSEGEAVVLRLRIGKDVPLAEALDAALAKAGITSLSPDRSTAASQWQDAYRRNLEAKYGPSAQENSSLVNATVEAAQAVFIEAPLERLEGALEELGIALKQPLQLQAESKLALSGIREPGPEGEPGSATGQPFAQRLNATLFRLEKKLAQAATAAVTPQPAGKPPQPQQLVRVLILVEAE